MMLTVAREGDPLYLTDPTTVSFGYGGTPASPPFPGKPPQVFASRMLSAGTYTCSKSVFGAQWGSDCMIEFDSLSHTVTALPGDAAPIAYEGESFRLDGPATIYFGFPAMTSRDPRYISGPALAHNVPAGSYVCNAQTFGPRPGMGGQASCWKVGMLAPTAGPPVTYYDELAAQEEAQQRAVSAAQAQADLAAAQAAIETVNADAALQSLQVAQDALAQQAAALAAAEAYRKIQEEAKTQAAQIAAMLAKYAAANTADATAAKAAAEAAATAEAQAQATAAASSDVKEQAKAYTAAQAAALVEAQREQEARARLAAAQDAAGLQAGNEASGGALFASLTGGMSSNTLLMIGGGALLLVLLLGRRD